MSYANFIASKRPSFQPRGFEPGPVSDRLFPFQRRNVQWAVRAGCAALFLDTGLGKTVQQLEWARLVAEHTSRPVILLAPLAVSSQTCREAELFGIPGVGYAAEQSDVAGLSVAVTNYERLHKFDPSAFGGVVLDESSVLKNYSGVRKRLILESFKNTPYRLACTATPAPNDHLELGNHAEFLGVMSSHQMLARWFINDTSSFGTYRLKGHARESFWDWVTSWAVLATKPSDLGRYSDDGYILPPMHVHDEVVDVDLVALDADAGLLFRHVEMSATQVHKEKRRTCVERAVRVAEIVAAEPGEPWLIWCDTNYEADALMAELARRRVSGVVEVRGSETNQKKERSLVDFSEGRARVMVTKPKIAGFGLNWQHCARVAFVGATYSFESWYQAVRRTWRFGQHRPVHVYMVSSTTARGVRAVMAKKRDEFESMQMEMVAAARRAMEARADAGHYNGSREAMLPKWMR